MFSLGAMGIGALIGALGSKQRGGNLVKGALTGAALGGIGGMLGNKFGIGGAGTKAGGLFGFGSKMMPNALALAGIGMGTEMLGQQEANAAALAGRRRWLDEEEERRIARLSKIAGYDVADSKNFLTPQSYFAARGGLASLPHYDVGGPVDGPFSEMQIDESEINVSPVINQGGIMDLDDLENFSETFEVSEMSDDDNRKALIQSLLSQRVIETDPDQLEIIDIKLEELGIPRQKAARGGMMELSENYDEELMMNKGGIARVHAKDGLWANIHAKRKRIAGGSGEKMRAPGSAGAPTDKALRQSQATGGIADLDMRSGGHSIGPGTGTSDDVPAMLSDGEFVVTAKAVENLGGGDRMEGAKKMYSMMNNLDPNSQTPGEMNYVGHG